MGDYNSYDVSTRYMNVMLTTNVSSHSFGSVTGLTSYRVFTQSSKRPALARVF